MMHFINSIKVDTSSVSIYLSVWTTWYILKSIYYKLKWMEYLLIFHPKNKLISIHFKNNNSSQFKRSV